MNERKAFINMLLASGNPRMQQDGELFATHSALGELLKKITMDAAKGSDFEEKTFVLLLLNQLLSQAQKQLREHGIFWQEEELEACMQQELPDLFEEDFPFCEDEEDDEEEEDDEFKEIANTLIPMLPVFAKRMIEGNNEQHRRDASLLLAVCNACMHLEHLMWTLLDEERQDKLEALIEGLEERMKETDAFLRELASEED